MRTLVSRMLTLCLWFPHPTLCSDETILDDLVDVLLLAETAFEVKIAHVLANVWLVDTLWMGMMISRIWHVLVAELSGNDSVCV